MTVKKFKILPFLILSLFSIVIPQEKYRTGLIKEDITKIPWIIKSSVLLKTNLLPSSVDLSQLMPPVRDQGNLGSCVAWAIGYYLKTYQEWHERHWQTLTPDRQFSPTFIYNQINNGVDNGSKFSDAVRLLTDFGCSSLWYTPYSTDFTSLPTENAYDEAMNYRISSAYYIDCSVYSGIIQLKNLLADSNLAVLGINIYKNFDLIQNFNNVYCVANKYGLNRGSHAIAIVGYDDNKNTNDGKGAFKFINSWAADWGDKGFGWISYKAIMDKTLSFQYVIYVTDKLEYTPKLKARIRLSHPARGTVSLKFGTGSVDSPLWEKNFNFSLTGIAQPFPNTNIVFDLSDVFQYLSMYKDNEIVLTCVDSAKDLKSGLINYYSIEYPAINQKIIYDKYPVIMPDTGRTSIVLKLPQIYSAKKISLLEPVNGAAEILRNINLKWKSLPGYSSYRLQISSNDNSFSKNIFLDKNDLSDTTFHLYGLSDNMIYFWRVNKSGGVDSTWSDINSFRTVSLMPLPDYKVRKTDYKWIDITNSGKKIKNWQNIDNYLIPRFSDSLVEVLDDGFTSEPIPIGFDFTFFGTKYNSLNVGINGVVSFTYAILNSMAMGKYLPPNNIGMYYPDFFPPEKQVFPNSIAVAYEDFNLNSGDGYGGGKILYQTINDKFILSWENVGSYASKGDTANSFQLVLDKASGSITIQFKNLSKDQTKKEVKVGIQKDDTLALMWISEGIPQERLIEKETAVIFSVVNYPASPVLLYPGNNSTNNPSNPFFNWDKSDDAETYFLQCSTDSIFLQPAISIQDIIETYIGLKDFKENIVYFWRVAAVNRKGISDWSKVFKFSSQNFIDTNQNSHGIKEFMLYQNYPNPFNSSSIIEFDLPRSSNINISIFNILGAEVLSLVKEVLPPGHYKMNFNGNNLASGMYFYRMKAENFCSMKKLLLLK